jgi:hypothetical protein
VKRNLAALALTALLVACGGGGDDHGHSGFTPPTGDFAAFTAWQNLLDPAASLSRTGITGRGSDGNDYGTTLMVEVAPDASFPLTGTTHLVTNLRSTLSGNGVLLGTGLTEVFFDTDWFVRGVRVSSTSMEPGTAPVTSTTCDEVLATSLPPVAAKVGDSGALYDATIRESCIAGAAAAGASAATWSVEFEAGIVFFCIETEDRGFGTAPVVTTEQDCIEMLADGTLGTHARVILTGNSPAFSLVARNY